MIDIISGRRYGHSVHATLAVDGVRVTPRQMRQLSGYVFQDDILPGTSTVWEHMVFHDTLRSCRSSARGDVASPPHSQNRRIWKLLEQLGLAKVAHSYIGDAFTRGLSDGEKRR